MQRSIYVGALFLLVAEAMFAGVGAMIKHLSDELSTAQLVFFRNLFALLFLLPFMLKSSANELGNTLADRFKTQRLRLHLFRAATGITAMYCFMYVLGKLPLAAAVMALKTSPFFIPLIAHVWLKERVNGKMVGAIAIGFVGVAFILQPEINRDLVYLGIALFCALCVALTKCTIRKMSTSEPPSRIIFYFCFIATLVSAIPLAFHWQPVSLISWLWLLGLSVLALTGQWLMTSSFRFASPVFIGILSYSSVIFAMILGNLIWNETINPASLVGIAIVLYAISVNTRQKWLF